MSNIAVTQGSMAIASEAGEHVNVAPGRLARLGLLLLVGAARRHGVNHLFELRDVVVEVRACQPLSKHKQPLSRRSQPLSKHKQVLPARRRRSSLRSSADGGGGRWVRSRVLALRNYRARGGCVALRAARPARQAAASRRGACRLWRSPEGWCGSEIPG